MKRFKTFNMLVTVLFLSFSLIMTGCSKDDDDNQSPNRENGLHKIEITMSDNAKDFYPTIVFNAFKTGKTYATIYDGEGKSHVPTYDVKYQSGIVTATTENGCFEFAASIMFSNTAYKSGDVTIQAKGYVDGKLIISDSRTISIGNGDLAKAAYFNSQSGFTDL